MHPDPPKPTGLRASAQPVHVAEACRRCHAEIGGWLYVGKGMAVVDTVGFMLIGGEVICDTCYGTTSDGTPPGQ